MSKTNVTPIIFVTGLRSNLDQLQLDCIDQKNFYNHVKPKIKIGKQMFNNIHIIDCLNIENLYKCIQNKAKTQKKYICVLCHIYNQDIIESLADGLPYICINLHSSESQVLYEINKRKTSNYIKQVNMFYIRNTIYPLYLDNIHGLKIEYYFLIGKESIPIINKKIYNIINEYVNSFSSTVR